MLRLGRFHRGPPVLRRRDAPPPASCADPRFHMYFTPASAFCLNMVERFFRDVGELIMAIGDYIDKHIGNQKPFVWTAKAADILEKVKRARAVLDNG